MDELLREFAQYTPTALLRIIADGATAILLLMPNLIGLALYALLVGWVVEKVISSISATLRHVRIRQLVRNRRTPLGTARARVATWLPMVAEKLVQAWTGLPVLYVLSLTLSHDSAAAGQLRRLVSGYRWQEGALAKLPLKTWLDSSHSSVWQVVLSVAVALLYANNSYLYFANGFFLAKRIRAAGDVLRSIVSRADGPDPTPQQTTENLKGQGWTDEGVASALWFLYLTNVRIMRTNPAYSQIGPRQYGLVRAAGALGAILALRTLHPLVAATKLYFEKKDIGEVRKTAVLYNRHLARLPASIQARLKS